MQAHDREIVRAYLTDLAGDVVGHSRWRSTSASTGTCVVDRLAAVVELVCLLLGKLPFGRLYTRSQVDSLKDCRCTLHLFVGQTWSVDIYFTYGCPHLFVCDEVTKFKRLVNALPQWINLKSLLNVIRRYNYLHKRHQLAWLTINRTEATGNGGRAGLILIH